MDDDDDNDGILDVLELWVLNSTTLHGK
jgi:hypothetical protein